MKFIVVTGGAISGIGKGIVSSSLGVIIQNLGLNCTVIKIDPYVNIDAGTFSPSEHGEVFVLDDGSEVDLDLGNYERFLNLRLTANNNITSGKIFSQVIESERRGDYLGKTVQYIPHITDKIRDWIENVAATSIKDEEGKEIEPSVCVIELGGTVGDIELMLFLEALKDLKYKVGSQNFLSVHVSLIIELPPNNEQKTKLIQNSVRELCKYRCEPDVIICRSGIRLTAAIKTKLSAACSVSEHQVISVPNMPLYDVPQNLVDEGLLEILKTKFYPNVDLSLSHSFAKWKNYVEAEKNCKSSISIALVGKYIKSSDAYASVIKATSHAALKCGTKINWINIDSGDLENQVELDDREKFTNAWDKLKQSDGMIVPGGFDKRGVEGKIAAIKYARLNSKPFLGICLGFQCAVVEYARNVLGLTGANSTEFDADTKYPVIIDMPEHNDGQMGGTMRLGLKKTKLEEKSVIRSFYGNAEFIEERHRHRYEVNPEFVSRLEDNGMCFVGKSLDELRMEILELNEHPYFVGTQYHPEFLSRPDKPSPPFVGLISKALDPHL